MEKVQLLDVCDVYQPQTIATKQFVSDGAYTVYGANGPIGHYTKYNHKESEVLMACRGATCGAINVSEPNSWINGNAMVIHPKGVFPLSRKYLMYYLKYANKDSIITGTAQPQITRHNLRDFKIVVCDKEEQERIVARIEELFSELDNGVETLRKTKQQLAVYRQAVLVEAFNAISDSVDMEALATMIDPQPSHRTPPEIDNGIPYIGIGDINYNTQEIDFEKSRKVSSSVLAEQQDRYTLYPGDFVMGKIGTIGKPFRLSLPQNYTLSANVILIHPNSKLIIPEFLFWQFSSPLVTRQLALGSTATSQPAFGIKKARKLQIKLCSLEKQELILQKIQEKMSLCDSIERTVDTALQQAEAMRRCILKQAFEGRL